MKWRADPMERLTRWREFQEAVASTRAASATAEANTARESRQRSLQAENTLRSERAALLGADALDLERVRLVESAEQAAAGIDRDRQRALESAEAVERAEKQAHLRARADLRACDNRRSRIAGARAQQEERRVSEIVIDTYLQRNGEPV
jgi:hypothetical protein